MSSPPLQITFFSCLRHEIAAFTTYLSAFSHSFQLKYNDAQLNASTLSLARNASVICLSSQDHLTKQVLRELHGFGVRLIVLRFPASRPFHISTAKALNIDIAHLPSYPVASLAEFAISLILSLTRKVAFATKISRQDNLAQNSLLGFNLSGITVGVIGTGRIGTAVIRILVGFGCRILVYDVYERKEVLELGIRYVPLKVLLRQSDIISLHAPLVSNTYRLFNKHTLARCKRGVYIVNISRTALLCLRDVTEALISGHVGGLAMDICEGDAHLYFDAQTGDVLSTTFQFLRSMPNVIITSRMAGLTTNALKLMVENTVKCFLEFQRGEPITNAIRTVATPRPSIEGQMPSKSERTYLGYPI